MNLTDFHTKGAANEGVKVPLHSPEGHITDEWLTVQGYDSDHFQKYRLEMSRRTAIESVGETDTESELKRHRELIARLVVGWSFEEECTFEKVCEWFAEAPQVQSAVEKVATDRSLFFLLRSVDSASTLKHKPDLTEE
jgi:hypothetical protein